MTQPQPFDSSSNPSVRPDEWSGVPASETTSGHQLDIGLPAGKVAVVASRYHAEICNAMIDSSVQKMVDGGVDRSSISVVRVPGAWEIPPVTQMLIDHTEFMAALVFGCVIRGETSHDQHINREVSRAIMDMTIASGKPIGFGLLTVNSREQAIARIDGTVGNKGVEAADAVLELLRLYARMEKAG